MEMESTPGVCDLFLGSTVFDKCWRDGTTDSSLRDGLVCLSVSGATFTQEMEFFCGAGRSGKYFVR